MKVAVAISHPVFEREVIAALKREGMEVVRRCLDDADIQSLPSDMPVYADPRFHAAHPRTILVRTSGEISHTPQIRTQTTGVIGPHGAPGVSTVALNLAVALQAALIDAAKPASLAAMSGMREGNWYGVEFAPVRGNALAHVLAGISRPRTIIDLGCGPVEQHCDELVVVVASHPLSVERYLERLGQFGQHRLVLNRIEPGPIGQTAHRMLDRSVHDVIVVPRDDRACSEAFIQAKPLREVAPRSAMVRAINVLAGIETPRKRGRIIAVG